MPTNVWCRYVDGFAVRERRLVTIGVVLCMHAAAIPSGCWTRCQLLCSAELANSKNGQCPQDILYFPSGHMVISSPPF